MEKLEEVGISPAVLEDPRAAEIVTEHLELKKNPWEILNIDNIPR